MIRSTRVASLILLVAVCGFTYLWIFSESNTRLIVYVQSEPSVYEMSNIIERQGRRIEYMSKHPEVIYRCPDDESKIKYPRQASDDLTEVLMGTNDECGDASITDAILIVHTAADHFQRRVRFRQTYANFTITSPYRLKVVFLIGSVIDAYLQIKLEIENREYGDTVMGVFLDRYQNLTLKAVMGFRWLTNTCSDVKLLIKMDDDVFFDVNKFFKRYWHNLSDNKKRNSIHCNLWHNAQVFRTGKWRVEKNLFANASYNFPYCSGFLVVISPDLIKPMYTQARSIDFFWIDDVFMFGMVPAAVGGVQFFQLGEQAHFITESYKVFKTCVKRTRWCPTWAVLTNGEGEFDMEYQDLISRTVFPKHVHVNDTVLTSNIRFYGTRRNKQL